MSIVLISFLAGIWIGALIGGIIGIKFAIGNASDETIAEMTKKSKN